MIIHVIQAAGPAFPTLPGKEKNAALFISETIKTTSTTDSSFLKSRSNIEKADQVVVSNEWDPYAYIEFGIAVELKKKIVVIKDDDLIESPLFPNYKDISYEISSHESVTDYLISLSKAENQS
jgi:hypothetical protein